LVGDEIYLPRVAWGAVLDWIWNAGPFLGVLTARFSTGTGTLSWMSERALVNGSKFAGAQLGHFPVNLFIRFVNLGTGTPGKVGKLGCGDSHVAYFCARNTLLLSGRKRLLGGHV
jgi:hypothetical protein